MNQWVISYFETRTLLLFYFFYHHSWSAYPGSFVGTSVIQRAITVLFHSSNPLKLSYGESGRAVLQVEEGIREESCGPSTHPDDSGIISYFSPRLSEIKSRRIEDVLMWEKMGMILWFLWQTEEKIDCRIWWYTSQLITQSWNIEITAPMSP